MEELGAGLSQSSQQYRRGSHNGWSLNLRVQYGEFVTLLFIVVLVEFIALSNARRLPRTDALTFASDLHGSPDVETVWVDKAHCFIGVLPGLRCPGAL